MESSKEAIEQMLLVENHMADDWHLQRWFIC
jgi:hypothetical protein